MATRGYQNDRARPSYESYDSTPVFDDESQPITRNTRSKSWAGYGGVTLTTATESLRADTHCHNTSDPNEPSVDKKARKKLIIASVLCLSFMLAEAIGGVLANSLAIATDAAHLLTDFASFMISLVAIHLASRPATKRMPFGWYRAEVMGAVVSVIMIWIVTSILVFIAVQRTMSMDFEINPVVMLVSAALGVGVNLIMGVALHDTHGHSHGGAGHSHKHPNTKTITIADTVDTPLLADKSSSQTVIDVQHPLSKTTTTTTSTSHGHGHGHSHAHGHSGSNINVRAAFIHVIGDLVQSIGVLIAAFIIFYKPEWKVADPICTFFFSILVLFTTFNILKDAFQVLMEGTPKGIDFNEVKDSLCAIKGVRELHNLRIWSLTLEKAAVSVHLAVDQSVDSNEVLSTASELMRQQYAIDECTVQLEIYTEEMDNCKQCKDPCD